MRGLTVSHDMSDCKDIVHQKYHYRVNRISFEFMFDTKMLILFYSWPCLYFLLDLGVLTVLLNILTGVAVGLLCVLVCVYVYFYAFSFAF